MNSVLVKVYAYFSVEGSKLIKNGLNFLFCNYIVGLMWTYVNWKRICYCNKHFIVNLNFETSFNVLNEVFVNSYLEISHFNLLVIYFIQT